MSTRTVSYRASPHGRHPLSHARSLDGARGHHRGRARRDLRRPGDRRGARARRDRPAAPAQRVEPAVERGEPALLQLVRPAGAEGPQRLPDVRSAHGAPCARRRLADPSPHAATLLRTMPRSRQLAGLAVAGLLGLGIGACGSTKVSDDVPQTVPDITVSQDAFASSADTSTTDTTSTSTTATTTTPTAPATSSGTGGGTATPAAPAAGTGGGATPQTGGGTAQGGGATPQTGGGTAQGGGTGGTGGGQGGGAGFQGFCQQNPGAC